VHFSNAEETEDKIILKEASMGIMNEIAMDDERKGVVFIFLASAYENRHSH